MNPDTYNTLVLHDARMMLEKAARLLVSLENYYFSNEASELKFNQKMSEALANVHAATARLE